MPEPLPMDKHRVSPLRVGLLDSGVGEAELDHVHAAIDLSRGDAVDSGPAQVLDRLGHGSTLARVICQRVPGVELCVAKIFDRRLAAAAEQAAAGLAWLVDEGAELINLSFGLRQNNPRLAEACRQALEAGVVLVASSPAMGAAVYPAQYPGVVRVTGDARCQPGEHSWRPSPQAEFGACVRAGSERVVGASVATAYVSALLARDLQQYPGEPLAQRLGRLRSTARYQQPQRPFATVPLSRRLTWEGAHERTG